MSRVLLFAEAREKILKGAMVLCSLVRLTLGPKGRNVVIDRLHAAPLITNDGVTIAREVVLDDPFENLGAQILKQASLKTNEKAGDGTTSAVVFGAELLSSGMRQVGLGVSPVSLKEGISVASDFVVDYVTQNARECVKYEQICAVATNSCANKNDGKLVADALVHVGKDGVVTIEENSRGETALTFSEGLELGLELASPYFCDNPERLETVFENVKLLIVPQVISSINYLVPMLEYAVGNGQNLVIIAEDFSSDVISGLVLNKVRGGVRVAALRAARLGARMDALLGDLAALTGAVIVGAGNDLTLENVAVEHLGNCSKIICNMTSTKVIGGGGERLAERIAQIRGQIEEANDEYTKVRLRERLASLTNGIAVISVGCATEIELRERKLRIEDALAAATVAMREGIVEGGGVAYIRAAQALEKHLDEGGVDESLRAGARLVYKSLDSILRQICVNAGAVPDIVLQRVMETELGFNAMTGEYVNMFDAAIVDPAAVIKNVVKNAASVVGTLLTTEGILINNDM